ncbi:small ribosomal subunit protein bS21 [Aquisphaera giovannonii]|uniref:small ribosomal subunit protein bS21 n=1 Tax=Aquisphaera giovannonii TaxID=406548 RepID=UPI00143D64AF|nr:bS21 family ribosomal protein [Aquisphaera giovannonii]
MGIRIEVEEGEPIAAALKRFRQQLRAEGDHPLHRHKWHKPNPRFYTKPSVLNRRRRWIIRAKKRSPCGMSPDPDYDWVDDMEMRPRRSWGRVGRHVIT